MRQQHCQRSFSEGFRVEAYTRQPEEITQHGCGECQECDAWKYKNPPVTPVM
jgi:hypothetical protein